MNINLKKVSRCLCIVEGYTESYPETWARKIIWAYKKLEDERKPFCWTDIRKISGVKKKNLPEVVLYLLKYMNESMVGKILNLILF